MTKPLRVLIIDDSEDDTLLLVEELRHGGYDVSHEQVYTESALRSALDTGEWDVILSDHSMPQFSGLVALKIVKENALDVPFIIVSGTMSEDAAVESMKLGAADYFSKNKVTRLIPAVERGNTRCGTPPPATACGAGIAAGRSGAAPERSQS